MLHTPLVTSLNGVTKPPARHTVGIEVRDFQDFHPEPKDTHPFAVVERLGSHVKVCAVGTSLNSLQHVAWSCAKTYGAEYVA